MLKIVMMLEFAQSLSSGVPSSVIVMTQISSASSSSLSRLVGGLCLANRSMPSTSPSFVGPVRARAFGRSAYNLFTFPFRSLCSRRFPRRIPRRFSQRYSAVAILLPSLSAFAIPSSPLLRRFLPVTSFPSLLSRRFPHATPLRSTLPQVVETYLCTWPTLSRTAHACLLSTF